MERPCVSNRAGALALLLVGLFAGRAGAATIDLDWRNPLNNNNATISVGDTVRWTWSDSLSHTVTSLDGTSFDSGTRSGTGATFEFTFNNAGTFDYRCDIHPGSMTGTITVQGSGGGGGGGSAENIEVEAFNGISVTNLDNPVTPGNFPRLQSGFAAPPRDLVIECFVTARQFGALITESNSSLGATLSGQLIDVANSPVLLNLVSKSNAIGPAGVGRFSWGRTDFTGDFNDSEALAIGVNISGSLTGSVAGGVDQVTLKCRALSRRECAKSGTNACLLPSQRFVAYALTQSGSRASVTSNSETSASFSVAGGSATVKLVNNCVPGGNNHFWVTVSSTTNATFTLVVEDTGSGEVVSYPNANVTDKAAFPTCPP